MFSFVRSISAMIGFGLMGCGGVTVREVSPANPHTLPVNTVERIQACTAEFGGELEPGQYNFNPAITVDTEGYMRGVEIPEVPKTAPYLGACMRVALGDMSIPTSIYDMRPTPSASTEELTTEQRLYVGNPAVVVVVVVVGVGEIVLEAGAITILFAATVTVVDKVAQDALEAAKRWRPKPNMNRCLDAAAGGTYLWEEFCRAISDPIDRKGCWARSNESEQNKRGWCNEKFGN